MRLGNYTWRICPKCNKRYAHVPGVEDEHKCTKKVKCND